MTGKQKWDVVIKEDEIKDGHYMYFLFPLKQLAIVQSRPFTVDYDVFCGSFPTSWTLTLIYKRKEEPYQISLSVTLSRIDRNKDIKEVYAGALMACLDSNNRLVRFTQEICDKRMKIGEVIQGHVEESASLVSILKVSIFVRYCHDTVDFDPDASLSSHVIKEVCCLE